MINSKLKRKLYESKKARDILDEEFIEFGLTKRNINEFFDIYNSKFYNIIPAVHDFFSKQSINYATDYINPKEIQKQTLLQEVERLQIEIDSIEQFHPILPNNTVITFKEQGNNSYEYHLIQSAKRRRIYGEEMINKVKETFRQKDKPRKEWTIDIADIIGGIPKGPDVRENEDLFLPLYTINTGKELPSNIYIG